MSRTDPNEPESTAVVQRLSESQELVRSTFYEPFALLREMFERFDSAMPRVDITHIEDHVLVQIDLPGLSAADIDVVVDEYSIELEGERPERGGGKVVHREREHGRFVRVIPLHQPIDPDSADATFENGVLEIRARVLRPRSSRERRLAIH